MKNLLTDAKHEIENLRRSNELLRAKVDVMDLFALVLKTEPARNQQGFGEDVAWKLDQAIFEIEKNEKGK